MNVRVVNAMKDRSKTMRLLESGQYEFGWLVLNRRDRSKNYFIRAGVGALQDAEEWMAATDTSRFKRRSVYVRR